MKITSCEYAGFQYEIHEYDNGFSAIPVEGQHPAASKDKHKRAALECWAEDNNIKLRK